MLFILYSFIESLNISTKLNLDNLDPDIKFSHFLAFMKSTCKSYRLQLYTVLKAEALVKHINFNHRVRSIDYLPLTIAYLLILLYRKSLTFPPRFAGI